MKQGKASPEQLKARLERRRSNAASPHRNRSRFYKGSRNDWKGLVMEDSNVVCIREGSSQRTAEELCLRFIDDTLDIVLESGSTAQIEEAQALKDEAVDSLDSFDAISDIADQAERVLSDAGFVVDWCDGYVISMA
jgi:hypothetical protein